jgi:hypothetical protein
MPVMTQQMRTRSSLHYMHAVPQVLGKRVQEVGARSNKGRCSTVQSGLGLCDIAL